MRRKLGRATRLPRAVISCAVIVAAVGVVTAACGGSQHPTALPHATCGSAVTHFLTGDTQVLSAHHGALGCFVRAARHCRPASLGVTAMGVDTGTDYVFSVGPGAASCQVTEYSQSYSANFGGSEGPVFTTTCRRFAATQNGVMLRCGRQQVLIPVDVSAPLTHPA